MDNIRRKDKRVPINTTISKTSFDSIQKLAIDCDTTNARAIDIIVSEWYEYKEVESARVNRNKIYLDTLSRKVELTDKLVNKLLLKLKAEAMKD